MRTDPVKYYYKDLATNIEMEFTKSEEWGWAVGFKNCSVDQMLNYRGRIPWPALSEAEQKIVDANYEMLRKACEEDEYDC